MNGLSLKIHTRQTIDKETFYKAQGLQSRDTRVSPKTAKLSLFAGFIKCVDCGQAMRRTSAKEKHYYVCRTNREKPSTACTTHSIRETALNEAVLITIQKQIDLIENMNQTIEEMNKLPDVNTKSDRLEKALRKNQMDLAKANAVFDSLYMDWKTGDITQEELDRNLLVCLIDKIFVHEDKHITIKFNFADTYMRVIEFIETNQEQLKQAEKPKDIAHEIVHDRPVA